ncbi:hypothetical protein FRB96_002307 [Tulasnella sp. 330]|nr:hypothetical protein FRB96_002307 [Tulasnella sp. 330]
MASEADLIAFIARQKILLTAEREADIERSSLILSSCSPKLLELKGLALNNLGVVNVSIGLGGKSLVELERPTAYHSSQIFPPHGFRTGDLARIEENTLSQRTSGKATRKNASTSASINPSASVVEGVVYKMTDTRVIIAVDQSRDSSSDDLQLPERCRVLKLANSVTYDRMDKAVIDLEKILQLPISADTSDEQLAQPLSSHVPPLNPLIEVLMDKKAPSLPSALATPLEFLDPSLNDSQKEAVMMCLEAQEVGLVHGPPGTGKTHTLIEVIRQFIARDLRVLVCGASNLAVDNLLERLLLHNIPLTRLGHPARVLSSLHSATLDSQAAASDESQIAKDVKEELETMLNTLAGKGKGGGKGRRPKGAERRKMWDEVRELRKEYRKRENVVVKNVMDRAKVVLATCHGAGGRQLLNAQFDILIIDEATQALEAVCWIPILKAKKLILAGDPLQLPPTILSMDKDRKVTKMKTASGVPKPKQDAKSRWPAKDAPISATKDEEDDNAEEDERTNPLTDSDLRIVPSPPAKSGSTTKGAGPAERARIGLRPSASLAVTLFDRLEQMYGGKIKRLLNVQYRMHQTICQFPSTALYHSKLISHSSVAAHLLRDLPNLIPSTNAEETDALDVPVIFFDTAGCEYFERVGGDDEEGKGKGDEEGSRRNENEAGVVRVWVEKLVQAGLQPSQIAVITPYQAQVTALTSLLRPKMPDLEIGTVDGMQGREKEAVVLSLREVGFLKEKRRLNVAMTRARRHLCVVGDSSTVSYGSSYLKSWMDWLDQNAEVRFAGLD